MEQTLPDYHLPSDKLYIVSKYDSGQSFVTISEARPDVLCSAEERVCPLRFSFMSPVLVELPFLFWVQFLRQLIGICHFSWFSPGSRLYEMVYTNANDVDQPPPSVSDCRLVLLIRLALYQYGYITDVPLNRMFVG